MADGSLERLHEALSALEAVDVAGLSGDELGEWCVGLHRAQQRLGVTVGRATAAWDTTKVWASNQSLSARQRLANEVRCSVRSARVELRRARKLAHMPHTATAVCDGLISLDLLDVLGRANSGRRRDLFAEHEAALVAECAKLRYPDAVRAVEYWIIHADALLGTPDPPMEKAAVHLSPVGDRWALNGDLDAISGTILNNELDRLAREVFLADQKVGIERSPAERRAAALVAMAVRSASASGSGNPRRPLFSVLVGDGTLAHLCELANGTVIRPAQLADWLDSALIETILFDGPSTILSVSHRRTFTGALRRAIQVRDRHCQHRAGRDTPAERCDVDHIVPAVAGGPTSQFNAQIECHGHNRIPHLHDTTTQPLPERRIDWLEQWRCQLRWKLRHEPPDPPDG